MKKFYFDCLKAFETNVLFNSSISELLTCKVIDTINC